MPGRAGGSVFTTSFGRCVLTVRTPGFSPSGVRLNIYFTRDGCAGDVTATQNFSPKQIRRSLGGARPSPINVSRDNKLSLVVKGRGQEDSLKPSVMDTSVKLVTTIASSSRPALALREGFEVQGARCLKEERSKLDITSRKLRPILDQYNRIVYPTRAPLAERTRSGTTEERSDLSPHLFDPSAPRRVEGRESNSYVF
ncbi:hypothetical protein EVAR_40405_1 [Eumeta japonica]|uniref:Uncharacterized protein n=1 Tax=Eumeta variegata TaxID=151549 RepID=A0A4C1WAB8_EUMVA|nr:hypothetical protein EVAR_40405_1 [Eumeta japonica]